MTFFLVFSERAMRRYCLVIRCKGTTKNANTQVEQAVYQKIIDFYLLNM